MAGGLAIQVNDDTLTLEDRIEHHFTTSMSTIEVASLNADKLNSEFKNSLMPEEQTERASINPMLFPEAMKTNWLP